MKKIYLCVIIASVFIFLAPMNASALGIEVAAGMWGQTPSGDISYKGESLSIKNELNYDTKYNIFGRVKIDMPLIIPNVYLMASPASFKGDGSKTKSFTFGDKEFKASKEFTTELKLDHYDVALYYGIPLLKTATLGVLNVEAGLDLRIFDVKAEIEQSSIGSASKSFVLPIPMVFLAAQVKPLKYLSFEVEGRGIAYSSNHYYDLIGRVKVLPFGPLFIAGGYRYEGLKINQSDLDVKISIGGPFLEAGFVF
jgi:outer membrane protein